MNIVLNIVVGLESGLNPKGAPSGCVSVGVDELTGEVAVAVLGEALVSSPDEKGDRWIIAGDYYEIDNEHDREEVVEAAREARQAMLGKPVGGHVQEEAQEALVRIADVLLPMHTRQTIDPRKEATV